MTLSAVEGPRTTVQNPAFSTFGELPGFEPEPLGAVNCREAGAEKFKTVKNHSSKPEGSSPLVARPNRWIGFGTGGLDSYELPRSGVGNLVIQ
jgi:hypothetical protein